MKPIVKKKKKQPRNLVDGEKTVTFPVISLFIYYIITGVVWLAIGEVSNRRKSCTAYEYTIKQSSINQSVIIKTHKNFLLQFLWKLAHQILHAKSKIYIKILIFGCDMQINMQKTYEVLNLTL